MAVNKKGSRRIVVEDTEFRWRATGNDGWITIVTWPTANDRSRIVARVGYHQEKHQISDDAYSLHGQLVVTNRLIRKLILHFGVDRIVSEGTQIDAGALEDIIDISDAVTAEN